MTGRVEWLAVGGPIDPWRRLGLRVDDHGEAPLFGPGLRIIGGDGRGIVGWALSGAERAVGEVDGLATECVEARSPVLVEHPIGAIGLDHVVVVTDALERTSDAIASVTGAPLRRIREVGELRQGFHRLGPLNVDDLDAAVERLGPDLIGPAKAAVQPGRSIATVRHEADLGLPVALMTP